MQLVLIQKGREYAVSNGEKSTLHLTAERSAIPKLGNALLETRDEEGNLLRADSIILTVVPRKSGGKTIRYR